MKKILSWILLAALAVSCLVFAGCGKTESKGIEVVFYHTMGANLRPVLQKYIDAFNKDHPEITITESAIGGYDDVRDQVITELQAGKQPVRLGLVLQDRVAVTLTDKGELKKLAFLDVVREFENPAL